MIKDHKYSCTSELGAEILMVITSFIIAFSVISLLRSELNLITRNKNKSDQDTNLFLSSAYALFLPLMSYMFSQAKQYNPEGRAQVILIWMMLIEIIRIRSDPIFTWRLQKSAEQLVRLFWVGFLVYSYTPLYGIRASLFVLCVYFAVSVVLKGVIFNIANDSYLIGKNPKVIHNYMKSVMLQDNLQTTPMSSCDYIVMGEENHEITVCDNGYLLGEKKSGTKGILTIGRVFELNSPEDVAFTSVHPYWRDTCLSLALAKMLRRRFAKLLLDEAGSRKALNFVLEGLIDYIDSSRDIQTEGRKGEINPVERVFSIIQDELKFISEFLHIKVPIYNYFAEYMLVDVVGVNIMFGSGVYLIDTVSKRSSAWLSLVAQQDAYNHCFFHIFRHGSVVVKIFSILDLAITVLLFVACIYIQYTGSMAAYRSKHWSNIRFVKRYIKDPARWYESYKSQKTSMSSKLLLQVANFTNNVLKGPKPRGEKVKNVENNPSQQQSA